MKIAIINGPNLNLLGQREPGIYGSQGFDSFLEILKTRFPNIILEYFQSNVEGELVNALQQFGNEADGIILNPAAYTHTSVAIGDCIAAIKAPVVEVHISNVHAREEFRKLSHVSAKAAGTICGLGLDGYRLAIEYFINKEVDR
ncbi:type II 3-dehydroquinate dehydratase [Niabella sp. 22666]|uniref:type II 3-dehydroquinate dehydratase n=1 Tax=Niabella sp. 22666 TaxID=3453954 RepID=UPI003F82A9F9